MTLSETDEAVFVNLKSGLVEKSFPHSSNKHSFHLFDGKVRPYIYISNCTAVIEIFYF
jgi:hypothetical protein